MSVTGLMILAGFFEFVLGKSLGWGANWAKDAAVGALKPANELEALFVKAASEWRAALPDEFRGTSFHPKLFWDEDIAIDKDDPSECCVASKLWDRESPTPDEFFRMLKNRYRLIQRDGETTGNLLPSFMTADNGVVDFWLRDLAERLREVCVGFPPLGDPTRDKQLRRIEAAVISGPTTFAKSELPAQTQLAHESAGHTQSQEASCRCLRGHAPVPRCRPSFSLTSLM